MITKITQHETTKEIFRIQFDGDYWNVQALSHVVENFITVGCWKSEEHANKDLEMWLST